MMKYMDLTDIQIDNLILFLGKANRPQLDRIKEDFSNLKSGKNNDEFKNNVTHALMADEINLNYFRKWAAQLFIHSANSIYVYEPKEFNKLFKLKKEDELSKLRKKINFLFDINEKNINGFNLIDIELINNSNQLLFSFVCPSTIIVDNEGGVEPTFEPDVYFSYIWLDYDLNQLVISLPTYPKTHAINGRIVKKNESDKVAEQVLTFFKEEIQSVEFINQDWIIQALNEITESYFDHNNPIITKRIETLSSGLIQGIADDIIKLDPKINNDLARRRVSKNLIDLLEDELIIGYGVISKENPFSIFLQVVDRGVAQYSAQNGGKAFSFADSREIVKKMIENAQISALGLIFHHEGKDIPYKIFKSNKFFALKRLSTGATEKEIVDNVLLELNQYKQRIEIDTGDCTTTEVK